MKYVDASILRSMNALSSAIATLTHAVCTQGDEQERRKRIAKARRILEFECSVRLSDSRYPINGDSA